MKWNISIVFFISILVLSLVLSVDSTTPAIETETTESITTIDETSTTDSSGNDGAGETTTDSPTESSEETTATELADETSTTTIIDETSTTESSGNDGAGEITTDSPTESSKETTTTELADETTTTTIIDETSTTESSGTDGAGETTTDSPTESSKETTTTELADETTTTTSSISTTTTKKPSFADNIETSIKNLLGINCVIDAIHNIEDITSNFEFEMDLCGSRAKRGARSIFNEIENLNKLNKRVTNIGEEMCKSGNILSNSDAKRIPTAKCVRNIRNAVLKSNESINKIIKSVDVYQTETSSFCAKISLLKFRSLLNNFYSAINECASISKT